MQEEFHSVIVVGAGPGGIAVASDLKAAGINDILILEKGIIGQSWLDYPPETRLLSTSSPSHDENMVGNISLCDVMPNIPHPSHEMYQRYLSTVVEKNELFVHPNTFVTNVHWNPDSKQFILTASGKSSYSCTFLVWAAGMYSTPNEKLNNSHSFIHYSRIQDWKHITDPEVSVVGGANGATEVVLQLAQPGRKIRLITSRFDIPEPIDCLWKENRVLVRNFEKQGLVEIIEGFRVNSIRHDDSQFILTSEDGKTLFSKNKPIVCIGFLPTIGAIKELVDDRVEGHDHLLGLTSNHESKKQPGLFLAGTIGKLSVEDDGFIRHFCKYGETIASRISALSTS